MIRIDLFTTEKSELDTDLFSGFLGDEVCHISANAAMWLTETCWVHKKYTILVQQQHKAI